MSTINMVFRRGQLMCECGCVMNDDKYHLRGPDSTIYVVSLSGACVNCDAPPGITIEAIDLHHVLYHQYLRGEFTKPLKLENWPDSKGVAIITGMRKHEFVKAMAPHLIGMSANDGLFDGGQMDQVGAECVAEEMYGNSQMRPSPIVTPGHVGR